MAITDSAKLTVHVERRAICEGCGTVFDSHIIPAHTALDGTGHHCGRVDKGARASVVVFRRGGEEVGALRDGAEVTGFFTADEVPSGV